MSKPVKALLRKDMAQRLEGVSSLAVVDMTGIDANRTHAIRARLGEKDIRLRVVRNSIARQAFRDVGLEAATALLDGPCALAYGADSVVEVVRELLDIAKDTKKLNVKAALMEGDVFGSERVEELSKFPTREEAIGQVLSCALSGGASIAGCLAAPGGAIAGILKAIEEGDEAEAA